MDVVWDTGSSWLVLQGEDCTVCDDPVYEQSRNPDTFVNLGGEYTTSYGDGTTTYANLVTDHVCLAAPTEKLDFSYMWTQDELACAEAFEFRLIYDANSMP